MDLSHFQIDQRILRALRGALMALFFVNADLAASEVTVAYDNAYPPYMYDAGRRIVGLYPTLVSKVFEEAGLSVQHRGYPWKRALELGRQGRVLVAGVYPNEQRQQSFVFSAPLFAEKLVIYVRAGQRFDYTGIGDLRNKLIGTVRGYTYGDKFDQMIASGEVQAYRTLDNKANFDLLMRGRVDCLIAEFHSAQRLVLANGLVDQVEQLAGAFYQSDGYLVAAKGSDLEAVLVQFNHQLTESRQDGSYQKWIDSFFESQRKFGMGKR